MPAKIAVNGYGTIGKRIADAITKLGEFELVGVAKYTPDYSAVLASKRGIRVYTPKTMFNEFRRIGVEPEGTVEELVDSAELIYDASPAGQGARNKELYVRLGKPAVFQGGEKPGIAEISYSTLCNYDKALGRKYVRVVSCNTTGILRVLCTLGPENLKSVLGVIIRRASDPREDMKGPVNSILLDPPAVPSHHSVDVATVIGENPPVKTIAIAVPSTLMHVQVLELELSKPLGKNELASLLESSGRVLLVNPEITGLYTTGRLIELARDVGRDRYDIYENVVFSSMVCVRGESVAIVQAIHQESIVIPENIDVAYAVLNLETDPAKVVEKVNSALGIGAIKAILSREP